MPDTYDRQWKSLPPEVLLALARLRLPDIEGPLTPWQTEIPVTLAFHADSVFLATIAGVMVLLHLEYQNSLKDTMPKRVYDYDRQLELLAEQYFGRYVPVITIVIWAVPGTTPRPEYRKEACGLLLAWKQYFEIHLAQMTWQSISDPLLLVLAPYFTSVKRQDIVPIAEQLYREVTEPLKMALAGAFLILSQTKFGSLDDLRALIQAKVGHTMEELFDAFAKSDVGIALMEKGEAEGIAKGEAKEAVKVFRRLWAKRFGAFPADIDAALQTASNDTIEQILDHLIEPTYTVEQARHDLGL